MDKNIETPLKWDEEEQRNWKSTFTETIRKFLHISSCNDNINNDVFAEIGESEEEKALIREQCEEIDDFYENRKALVEAKKADPELRDGDWLLQEMEKKANKICLDNEGRNMNPDEIKEFRKKVKELLDKNILSEAKGLGEDLEMMNEVVLKQKEEEKNS